MTAARKVHYDAGGRARCGHGGARLTAGESAVTCAMCLNLLAGVHNVGVRPLNLRPCGTLAAYRRHQRRDERVDESCRQAHLRDQADRRARKRRERKGLAA